MKHIQTVRKMWSASSWANGFTLIEVMITVAIVAILAAIALPSYADYVLRGRLVDGSTGLAAFRANMERYFQDNRTYAAVSAAIVPPCDTSIAASPARTVGTFVITCSVAPTTTTYTLQAQGSGTTASFTYTIDQTGAQRTTAAKTGWGAPADCFIVKRGQTC